MIYKLNFDSSVALDTQRVYDYYIGLHVPNSANLFIERLNKTYDLLEQNPYLFRVYYKDIHCAVVKGFPYLIHYQIDKSNNSVLVLSIYPANNKPIWEY